MANYPQCFTRVRRVLRIRFSVKCAEDSNTPIMFPKQTNLAPNVIKPKPFGDLAKRNVQRLDSIVHM